MTITARPITKPATPSPTYGGKVSLQAKRPEDFMRNLMRAHFTPVTWVEPTPGSSAGNPDCEIYVNHKTFSLELKAWQLYNGKVTPDLRPTQYRYHRIAQAAGKRTAILALGGRPHVANRTRDEIDPLNVYIVPAHAIEHFMGREVDFGRGGVFAHNLECVGKFGSAMFGKLLTEILMDEEFWDASKYRNVQPPKPDKLRRQYTDDPDNREPHYIKPPDGVAGRGF